MQFPKAVLFHNTHILINNKNTPPNIFKFRTIIQMDTNYLNELAKYCQDHKLPNFTVRNMGPDVDNDHAFFICIKTIARTGYGITEAHAKNHAAKRMLDTLRSKATPENSTIPQ